MILKHAREPINGQPVENTFVAIDEKSGAQIGSAVIYPQNKPIMFPLRPLQVLLDLDGTELPDRLIGAAVARAREICVRSEQFCRLYTQLEPDDAKTLRKFTALGFSDNDGLVRMQMRLPTERDFPKPKGVEIVRDDLSNEREQRYFLDRFNLLYETRCGMGWLHSYIDRKNFQRVLMLSGDGIMAEALTWRDGYAGVIGYFQVAKPYRHMGVGKYLISLACDAFESQNLYCAESNVRARYPHVLKLMQSVGFKQVELLTRYPGVDINPKIES